MTRQQGAGRGRLRIYLGYAAGVGKTYKMLIDAHLEIARGTDVVIGYFEPHQREETLRQAAGIEMVPRQKIQYRERLFEEMNPAAIIRRLPAISLVDELAHTNVPGSGREKRWEDVLEILAEDISVWTTMNVQHLEGLNDEVWSLTGIRVRETAPDWILERADEVVVVDLPPDALLNRLKRGVVYPPDVARRALENFFREGNLAALRELTLRHAAHQIETTSGKDAFPEPVEPAAAPVEPRMQRSRSRMILLLTPDPATASLIRRAKRLADYLRRDCLAVYVSPSGNLSSLQEHTRRVIERHLQFARNLQIETRVIQGRDLARSLVEFARRNQASEIYVHRERYRLWDRLRGRNLVHRIVRQAPDLRVTVAARNE
jgi:two-component system sensor histidine kinase KdpD